jgi:hypothetical protein
VASAARREVTTELISDDIERPRRRVLRVVGEVLADDKGLDAEIEAAATVDQSAENQADCFWV